MKISSKIFRIPAIIMCVIDISLLIKFSLNNTVNVPLIFVAIFLGFFIGFLIFTIDTFK
jgi:hypothetical protein